MCYLIFLQIEILVRYQFLILTLQFILLEQSKVNQTFKRGLSVKYKPLLLPTPNRFKQININVLPLTYNTTNTNKRNVEYQINRLTTKHPNDK